MTTSKYSFRNFAATARTAVTIAGAMALVVTLAGSARAATFLDEVDRGKAAVAASDAPTIVDAAARAAAVDQVVARDAVASPAFTIGATMAALNLDLERPKHARGDRAVLRQQVRDLLAAQADSSIGNRALCLLSGRSNPRSLEEQIRVVEPGWSCGGH